MDIRLEKEYRQTSPDLVDITSQAHVSASSSQPSHGTQHLVDNNPATFWQSNGGQPHTITIKFGRRVELWEIWLFFDYAVDESYTPSVLELFVGTGEHDLISCANLALEQPRGWMKATDLAEKGGVNCHMLMLKVLENHMGGKDSLIRGIRVYTRRPARQKYSFI